jgi:butyrate response factor
MVIVLLVKYKTELCRNFSSHGCCSYSSRCQFAHGRHELRCRTRHPKYKTELCRNFLSGFCKYGSRCQFVHQSDDRKTRLTSFMTHMSNCDYCSNRTCPMGGMASFACRLLMHLSLNSCCHWNLSVE